MPTMLTVQTVKGATVPKRRPRILWDRGAVGLGLKITPRGRRIWILQLRYPGSRSQSKRTLGDFPALGLEEARTKAKEWYAQAKEGIDPAAAEEEKKRQEEERRQAEAARKADTFSAIAETYISGRQGRRANTDAQEIRRLLVSEWGPRPLGDITPQDVRRLIDRLKEKSPYVARTAWGFATAIFKLAVHDIKIAVSPCASLDKRQLFHGAKIRPRQRVLNDDEVFALWRAASCLSYPAGPFYQLLLLTGARLNELGEAEWTELHPELRQRIREAKPGQRVDWAAVPSEVKVWTVPAERFKSDAVHIVHLSDLALDILAGLPRMGRYLFTLDGKKPVWFGNKIKRRVDARMLRTLKALARKRGDDPTAVKLPHWVNHDLRRVVRSKLSELQVADHVAEMVIGHGRRGIQRVYDQHRYAAEMRDALEKWAQKVRSIVEPSVPPPSAQVIPLPARRRQ